MLTPMIQILIYLSATFLLGLCLGWVLWRVTLTKELTEKEAEVEFWETRYNQTQFGSGLNQDQVDSLEKTRPSKA